MFGGAAFAFFGGLHFWWPKMFGRMYSFKPAYLSTILVTVGFVLHYVPMLVLGLQGMPRRYYDYLPQFQSGNLFAGIGAFIMVAGLLLMFFNLVKSLWHGERAPADPWGGTTLEWSVASPPPLTNFSGEPEVLDYPYDFSRVIARWRSSEQPGQSGAGQAEE
jgi:cytochrome c oxidase subunit 1